MTAYTMSNLVPRFETVPGIGPVTLYSGAPSLHATIDPLRLQALGLTPAQIRRR